MSNQSTGGIVTTTYQQEIDGLTGGDIYQFRIRADHNDGSVSAYNQSQPLLIQQADAPLLTVTNSSGSGDYYKPLTVSWSGAAGGVTIEVQSDALPGGPQWYSVWYTSESTIWPATDGQGSAAAPAVYGNGSYTYRIRSVDIFGNPTKWSQPQTGVS